MSQAPTGSSPIRRPSRAVRWWLAGGFFAVGLLVGVVIAGLLIRSSPDVTSDEASVPSSGTPSASGSADPSATESAGAEIQIVVNEACLRAVNAAEDAYGAIDRIGSAVSGLDLTALDGIIRELQPLQQSLRDDIAACTVSARLPDGSLQETSLPGTSESAPEPTVIVTGSSTSSGTTSTPPTTSTAVTTTSR